MHHGQTQAMLGKGLVFCVSLETQTTSVKVVEKSNSQHQSELPNE